MPTNASDISAELTVCAPGGAHESLPQYVVVLVTCSTPVEAETIAKAVVTEALAACVSRIPTVQSYYQWEGAFCEEAETLLVIKTQGGRLGELLARIKSLHSYTVPEFIALPVIGGSTNYLSWITANTSRME